MSTVVTNNDVIDKWAGFCVNLNSLHLGVELGMERACNSGQLYESPNSAPNEPLYLSHISHKQCLRAPFLHTLSVSVLVFVVV